MCSITNEIITGVTRDDNGQPLATVTTDTVTVHVGRSTIDSVPYVMIDTDNAGPMRVDLNDGNIWDGDPEQDQAHWLDQFDIIDPINEPEPILKCVRCDDWIEPGKIRVRLREFVADAKLHNCEAAA